MTVPNPATSVTRGRRLLQRQSAPLLRIEAQRLGDRIVAVALPGDPGADGRVARRTDDAGETADAQDEAPRAAPDGEAHLERSLDAVRSVAGGRRRHPALRCAQR